MVEITVPEDLQIEGVNEKGEKMTVPVSFGPFLSVLKDDAKLGKSLVGIRASVILASAEALKPGAVLCMGDDVHKVICDVLSEPEMVRYHPAIARQLLPWFDLVINATSKAA